MLLTILFLAVSQHVSQVEFAYQSATAKKVQLAGDFDAWSSTMDMTRVGDKWVKSVDLPDNCRIEYKLVVDGNWITDPNNPRHMSNGLGGENSIWQGPRYKISCHDQPPKTPLIRTELRVGGRTIVVFAPSKSDGLPVLMYGDGPTYENPGKIQVIVENLVEARKIRPVVLALIPPIDRMKEYGPEWKAYGTYALDEVLPEVRKATGASTKPEDVFMGGSSMGGLISLRLAEEYPDKLAGGIHSQSAAIQWTSLNLHNEDVSTVSKLNRIAPTTRISLDWGTFESSLTDANVQLAKTLTTLKRPFSSKVTPEGHNWTAWRNRMEAGLIYLLGTAR
ncbi:MAG: alpha/beta hydrolase-fold protein [Fimbriimonas sp.]|nr:alpha/beta hydrolase-fold protein [Fimbriimonas sp.]